MVTPITLLDAATSVITLAELTIEYGAPPGRSGGMTGIQTDREPALTRRWSTRSRFLTSGLVSVSAAIVSPAQDGGAVAAFAETHAPYSAVTWSGE